MFFICTYLLHWWIMPDYRSQSRPQLILWLPGLECCVEGKPDFNNVPYPDLSKPSRSVCTIVLFISKWSPSAYQDLTSVMTCWLSPAERLHCLLYTCNHLQNCSQMQLLDYHIHTLPVTQIPLRVHLLCNVARIHIIQHSHDGLCQEDGIAESESTV